MVSQKTKIVLDADVINHFAKGGLLPLLPKIFPEFQYIVLDVVRRELLSLILPLLEKQVTKEKNIYYEVFGASSGEKKEYLRLTSTKGLHLGRGESACMVYCRYHHDVVGSSNLKDITDYCDEFGITYLTTNDFLFYAIRRGLLTKEQADSFVADVRSKGSRLPRVDFDFYFCDKI